MSKKITENMTFGEVMRSFPASAEIMAKYGLHCIGCRIANTETIAEGAAVHGFDSEKLNQLIEELNNSVRKRVYNKYFLELVKSRYFYK